MTLGCENMQNFPAGDDRRAQKLLRGNARSSVAVVVFGAQEICGQTTLPTARPQEDIGDQAANSAGRIDAAIIRYFCRVAAKLLETSNGDCASSMTLWLWRNAELLNK